MVVSVLAAAAIPPLLAGSTRSHTWAAARHLASRLALARSRAALHASNVAVRFEETSAGISFQMFSDGDHDGVRTADIAAHIDMPVGTPVRLSEHFPDVDIGVLPELGSDPVRIGATDLLSFTPIGTATSGSIYVLGADGTQLVVRVLGATGRTRVERYLPDGGTWISSY